MAAKILKESEKWISMKGGLNFPKLKKISMPKIKKIY